MWELTFITHPLVLEHHFRIEIPIALPVGESGPDRLSSLLCAELFFLDDRLFEIGST
jgi:hypothetical protein